MRLLIPPISQILYVVITWYYVNNIIGLIYYQSYYQHLESKRLCI